MKKQEKKFVLAGLVLLAAITMVLLPLAGCKNDSVPETPAAKLVSISVTTLPTRTVYSVGQSFDPTGMVVTATYNAGDPKDVTSLSKTDFDFSSAGVKTVTVSYSEGGSSVTKDFPVDVVNVGVPTKLTTYTSPNNTDNSWTYVAFGEWPQTILKGDVEVDETNSKSKSKTMGMFTYYLGSDGNWYVKEEENAIGSGIAYKYSNGEQAGQGGTSTKWFKVEPIVWRVLTTNFTASEGGNALLLAESILTGGIPYYVDLSLRTIAGIVYPNNWQYSTIRAWLNGRYEEKDSQLTTYTDKGFLQTAFTADAQSLIAVTSVDNSAASTNPASNPKQWEEGENPYASDTPTKDKVFLLSEKEATTGAYLKEMGITDEDYGFDEYSRSGKGNTRIRVTTDYAKATGAYQDSTEGYGGWWWLRSPIFDYVTGARVIYNFGLAYNVNFVDLAYGGVVPALSISLQ